MDAPKLPGVAGEPRWGGGTAPSSPNFRIGKQLWLCAANPWVQIHGHFLLCCSRRVLGCSWMTHLQPSVLSGCLYHF